MHACVRALLLIYAIAAVSSLHGQTPSGGPGAIAPPFPDCGTPHELPPHPAAVARAGAGASAWPWDCAPPYQTPVYTQPPDDRVALGSLLEAAGHSRAVTRLGWVRVAAGSFCGGTEKQLVVMTTHLSGAGRPPHVLSSGTFSLLGGPTPHIVNNVDIPVSDLDPRGPWMAVAAGRLNANSSHDQIVAVRRISNARFRDLVVFEVPSIGPFTPCVGSRVVASATIGTPSNSNWVGAAIGNFDGTGKKQIALLKTQRSNLSLVELSQNHLNVVHTQDFDADASHPSQWRALAAGDIDNDGKDELIAVRAVSDGHSPTVLAFKWNGSAFQQIATSRLGNKGNSDWGGVAMGDFNADGRKAIVLVKNKHWNFTVMDLPPNSTGLSTVTSSDLESAQGQLWTGLAATDWLQGDQGADELIAVRAVHRPYRTNVFVYGNPFHRVSRDTGLDGTKAQYSQQKPGPPPSGYGTAPAWQLKQWMRGSYTNTFNWHLKAPGDYARLVEFLHVTKNWGVDGRQFRVWVTIIQPSDVTIHNGAPVDDCSQPEATPQWTTWDARDYFKSDLGGDSLPDNVLDVCHLKPDSTPDVSAPECETVRKACRNILAWASVIGRLAQEFPHLVAMGVDDFSDTLDADFPPDTLAQIEARLRSQAPWLNFVPTSYYSLKAWPDVGLTLDSILFYFRNQKQGQGPCRPNTCPFPDRNWSGCLAGTCAEPTVANAPGEIADMLRFLPAGRKMHEGVYFTGHSGLGEPSARYDFDLARLALNLPTMAGVTVYTMQIPVEGVTCDEFNFLDSKYCTVWKVFGGTPQNVAHADLTQALCIAQPAPQPAKCPPAAAGDPYGYIFDAQGVQNVVFRAADGHVHGFWRTSQGKGDDNLSALANAPKPAGNPQAYAFPAQGFHNVVYRDGSGHVHRLFWTTAAVDDDDLTSRSNVLASNSSATAAGDAFGYIIPFQGFQNVVYRGKDGHLHGLYWSNGPVGHDDLTKESGAPPPAGDPVGYVSLAQGIQDTVYVGTDGHLHGLYWSAGAVGHDDLTVESGAPKPSGKAAAYFNEPEGTHHVIYRDGHGHIHELYWSTGAVGSGDLTALTNTPAADSNPSAYFVTPDGRHHVVYRSSDGHLHELYWTRGIVTHNDLTLLANAPRAKGNPSAYFFAQDGMHHVIYRGRDDHLHELRWRN